MIGKRGREVILVGFHIGASSLDEGLISWADTSYVSQVVERRGESCSIQGAGQGGQVAVLNRDRAHLR